MKPKHFYAVLCIAGAVLPYWAFLPWIILHGLNVKLFMHELFANRISTFFALDVILSAVALLAFIPIESSRFVIKHRWLPVLATLLIGVSLGLPLFLYLRELRFEKAMRIAKSGPIGGPEG
jgi:hypothetical protein